MPCEVAPKPVHPAALIRLCRELGLGRAVFVLGGVRSGAGLRKSLFRGRQRAHPEMGYRVMETVAETLGDISKIETHPKMNGPRMTMLLARK